MNLTISLLLSITILSGIGVAYSQTEPIPSWIKGVAGFWVEDKITDLEFVEALEFLIDSEIIQVNNPIIEQLKKENMDLTQKIESLESKKTQQPETEIQYKAEEPTTKPHITIDKNKYTLGDTIHVTGLRHPESIFQKDNGYSSEVDHVDHIKFIRLVEYNNTSRFVDHCTVPYSSNSPMTKENDNRTFSCDLILDKQIPSGKYKMYFAELLAYEEIHYLSSTLFTIQ